MLEVLLCGAPVGEAGFEGVCGLQRRWGGGAIGVGGGGGGGVAAGGERCLGGAEGVVEAGC